MLVDIKAGNIRRPALVEHVQQIVVQRQADWSDASRINDVDQLQFVLHDLQDRDQVAAGVNGKQKSITMAYNQRALRRQWISHGIWRLRGRIAGTTGGKFGRGSQHAFGVAAKNRDRVVGLIRQNIHGTCAEIFSP